MGSNYLLAFLVYIMITFFYSSPLGFDHFNLQNVHQGHVTETLIRFLKAREWDLSKAHKMVRYTMEVSLFFLQICS